MPIETEEQAQAKACQLLGSPPYFRASLTKLQPAIDNEHVHLPPQWIVTADIGRLKKSVQVCVMLPAAMDPVPQPPLAGTFEAKLWELREQCRETMQLLDLVLPNPPPSGAWWLQMDRRGEALHATLKRIWEDKFK
jgi:hypothetical protein